MSEQKALVDTSVILRYYARDDPLHIQAVASLQWLEQQGYILCVAPQVLYEMWVVMTRPKARNGFGMTAEEAYELLQQVAADFLLLPDQQDLWLRWMEVCRQYSVLGREAHDARLVAWMASYEIKHLCTFNPADFNRYPEVKCVP